ncbi:sigma-70 family RNA polymerase sigma factor [Rhodococcoides kyotonense]|uniref:RNA polymerase sigma-70 factor, ECF subfamily n=1 Tax=Rhodococcoides kyotonense TaxID=398843 RepID=A0A239EAE2_9NOCA|nr:sigma-70 family RNA polymerase sigma factor [Rhodococcus kyotonensis]SNS40983.1 RNA polymerase sigma-70 factor, ECF subfamily [Rhodococcus kyotonensis]
MSTSTLADRFQSHRGHLLAVGYRVTGSVADAEDAVQESWLRLSAADASAIEDLRGWLTTVVARLCLDRLKSATVRRETYVGQWLPEPIVSPLHTPASDPLDVVVADEDTRLAALVVLDTLSPAQRVAFVLHDGFAVPFAEIADVLDVSTAAARQLASRARKQVDGAPSAVSDAEHDAAVTLLMTAMASGDLDRVVAALHPECRTIGDSGGTTRTAVQIVHGPRNCARFYLGLVAKYGPETLTAMVPASVNGQLGYFSHGIEGEGGFPSRAGGFTVRDGLVWASYDFANPAKLRGVTAPNRPTEPDTSPPNRNPAR